jgi:hypothetical protein
MSTFVELLLICQPVTFEIRLALPGQAVIIVVTEVKSANSSTSFRAALSCVATPLPS